MHQFLGEEHLNLSSPIQEVKIIRKKHSHLTIFQMESIMKTIKMKILKKGRLRDSKHSDNSIVVDIHSNRKRVKTKAGSLSLKTTMKT